MSYLRIYPTRPRRGSQRTTLGMRSYRRWKFHLRRIWRFLKRNPVNDGIVFWIRAVAYDLAVKFFSNTPAGRVLYGHRIDETSFAESCVSPLNKCSHDFAAKTLSVCAFLEPKAEFRQNRIRVFQ